MLRNVLSLREPEEIRASGAKYLIAHLAGCKRRARALLRKHFGNPILYDPKMALFDLSPD